MIDDVQESFLGWIMANKIRNERDDLMEWREHYFLIEPASDWFPKQVCMKSAQVGFSTLAILKTLYAMIGKKYNCIYALPTADDVHDFVPAKVDGIIKNNPCLVELLGKSDAITKKNFGNSFIWYRGTHGKKAALMHTSDLNIYDEYDACNFDVVDLYASRLQKSKYRGEWKFSNPITPGGIDKQYMLSDMRQWMVKCSRCNEWQALDYWLNVDKERQVYICSKCGGVMREQDRHDGEWVAQYPGRSKDIHGYHINQLMASWIPAKELVYLEATKSPQFFHNMVLGLPWVDSSETVNEQIILKNLIPKNNLGLRNAMGVDQKFREKHYVIGNHEGIFKVGVARGENGWQEIEELMRKYNPITVIDAGPDSYPKQRIVPRNPGRAFVCLYRPDKMKQTLIRWGQKDERGTVCVDRSSMIQDTINAFLDGELRFTIGQGNSPEQYLKDQLGEYMEHWKNIYKTTRVEKGKFIETVTMEWAKKGADDYCFTGDTLIATSEGDKEIEDVKIGDYVMTRKGFKRVLRSGRTKQNAGVFKYFFSDGRFLKATKNHKIFIQGKDYVSLHATNYGDKVIVLNQFLWKLLSFLLRFRNLMERNIINAGDISNVDGKVVRKDQAMANYIKLFGNFIMGLLQKVCVYTTKMRTKLIIRLRIWDICPDQSIKKCMLQKGWQTRQKEKRTDNILIGLEENPHHGIKQRRALLYIKNSLNILCRDILQLSVLFVQKRLLRRAGGEINIVRSIVPPQPLDASDVYNLEVEDEHEYFANGILVSNCHATNYYRIALSKVPKEDNVYDIMSPPPGVLLSHDIFDGTIPSDKMPIFAEERNHDAWLYN